MTKKTNPADEQLQEQPSAPETPQAPQPDREKVTLTADTLDGIHDQYAELLKANEGNTIYAGAVCKNNSTGKYQLFIDIVKQPKTE